MGQPQHAHSDHHHADHSQDPGDDLALADLLELDAEVFASHLDDVLTWVEQHAPATVRRVVDIGAGTGTGTVGL